MPAQPSPEAPAAATAVHDNSSREFPPFPPGWTHGNLLKKLEGLDAFNAASSAPLAADHSAAECHEPHIVGNMHHPEAPHSHPAILTAQQIFAINNTRADKLIAVADFARSWPAIDLPNIICELTADILDGRT